MPQPPNLNISNLLLSVQGPGKRKQSGSWKSGDFKAVERGHRTKTPTASYKDDVYLPVLLTTWPGGSTNIEPLPALEVTQALAAARTPLPALTSPSGFWKTSGRLS